MAEETRCVLRLYGAPQGRLAAAVALFAPQWRAEAQWKSRGAETLLAVHADTPTADMSFNVAMVELPVFILINALLYPTPFEFMA